ncbi:GTP cyclohydrolase 1 [Streptomyces anthocyanicus]|uniref:GTP cyclohydrolase I n=1 Tax=Streptomyces TaxID=1883 RepID=UPI00087B8F9D|nr:MULTISPECIES: GTP cyclohydrolase I FolE [Streptomyces]REH24933.1 GTP cyclohydrolase I [Streptomyces sp. 2221.1]GGL84898.1 GTP cyclohydrolase 1 [Streptomyces anthocyanicus]SDT79886.1 GTP cyclohydrolase I [Streptomyces sp. 2114.2]
MGDEFKELTEGEALRDPLETMARQLLIEIGENPDREGLADTPRRYARWWREFTDYQPGVIDTVFESVSSNQTVMVSDMNVWSLCEHHLLPFNCSVSIAYRARNSILGLSKFARIAHKHAHKLQLQERLIADIADEIEKVTGSPDVAVVGRGEHLCMTMRGIRTSSLMTSAVYRGVFEKEGPERGELLSLLLGGRK